jgi:hypothetical protein
LAAPVTDFDDSALAGLIPFDGSKINIIGSELKSVLLDSNFEGLFSEFKLTGHLADRTDLGRTPLGAEWNRSEP